MASRSYSWLSVAASIKTACHPDKVSVSMLITALLEYAVCVVGEFVRLKRLEEVVNRYVSDALPASVLALTQELPKA
jgi:hypothetical protein